MPSTLLTTIDLPTAALEPEVQYLRNTPRIAEVYNEFARGYWKNTVLWNQTADVTDDRFRDSGDAAVPTHHVQHLPVLAGVLHRTFDFSRVLMVRSRNLVDAVVLPHRDFTEMPRDAEAYCRLFLPLEATPGAFHSDATGPFAMQPGEVWYLDAKEIHTAVNFTSASRIFVCIDFALDPGQGPESVLADADAARHWPALSNHVAGLRAHMVDARGFGDQFHSTNAEVMDQLRATAPAA